MAPGGGVSGTDPQTGLQAALQIPAYLLDQSGMVIEEVGDALQTGVEVDALMDKFQIGEAELRIEKAAHGFFSLRSSWWFNSRMRSKVAFSLR